MDDYVGLIVVLGLRPRVMKDANESDCKEHLSAC